MPLYNQDTSGTMRLNGQYSTYCRNQFNVRPEHEKAFGSIIGSVPSINTYKCKDGVLITRFIKDGNGVLTSDEKHYIIIKRKTDRKDYLSTIRVEEYSPEFLTLV